MCDLDKILTAGQNNVRPVGLVVLPRLLVYSKDHEFEHPYSRSRKRQVLLMMSEKAKIWGDDVP